ncbi:ephrin-B3 isoform X2 [Anas platyrhynchos]|uniref:ephrin-B3 isoform X2 n=1 Tax=Anas platyrhynchos TaxID=8839 RepID=UPI003AF2F688
MAPPGLLLLLGAGAAALSLEPVVWHTRNRRFLAAGGYVLYPQIGDRLDVRELRATIKFQEFSPSLWGHEFRRLRDYYIITTSDGTPEGLENRQGGACETRAMRVTLRVGQRPGAGPAPEEGGGAAPGQEAGTGPSNGTAPPPPPRPSPLLAGGAAGGAALAALLGAGGAALCWWRRRGPPKGPPPPAPPQAAPPGPRRRRPPPPRLPPAGAASPPPRPAPAPRPLLQGVRGEGPQTGPKIGGNEPKMSPSPPQGAGRGGKG